MTQLSFNFDLIAWTDLSYYFLGKNVTPLQVRATERQKRT